MKKKQKQTDRRIFKKEGEELQQWLIFRKRGSKVESGKKYNRQKFKKMERSKHYADKKVNSPSQGGLGYGRFYQ